jgi:hypothetical protein
MMDALDTKSTFPASASAKPHTGSLDHPTAAAGIGRDELIRKSFTSSNTTLMDTPHHAIPLPVKKYSSRFYRNLRYTWLITYRRLNILCLLPNLASMILLGTVGNPRLLQRPLSTLAAASSANFLAAILVRQELVINALFITAGNCPQWWPLRIRRLVAKIYHLGGVHSGAAVAGTIWFAVLSVAIFKSSDLPAGATRRVLLSITVILDALLILIVATTEPHFRQRFHDYFEWCQ